MKKNIYSRAFVIFFLFLLSSNTYADPVIQNVKELLEEGHYVEAISQMEQLPKEKSLTSARILNALGWAYLKIGNYKKAKNNLQASFELAKDLDNKEIVNIAANNLGILAYLENDLDQAEKYFNVSKKANSQTALTYLKMVDKKKTQIQFQEALLSGIELRRKQDFKGAIDKYEKALSIEPNDVGALEFKGYALLRNHQYDLSVKTLEKAKILDPSRKFTHLNLVKAYCMLHSEKDVQRSIEESGLKIDKFIEWYNVDTEFRQMCRQNIYVNEFISKHRINE